MKRSKASMLTFATFSMASACFGQPKEPCFAFLLKGDLIVVCQGRTTRITHRGDIEHFAVSDESSSLAYTTSRIIRRDAVSATAVYTATVVNLKTAETKQVIGVTGVVSSCGGILTNQVGQLPGTQDIVTGQEVSFAPYVRFRCSTDHRVVAGITRGAGGRIPMSDLYEGLPPSRRIAAAEDVYVHYFNVSPDGSRIAWFNDGRPLCVLSGDGPAQCVDHSTLSDPVSVNNGGEVLIAAGTGQGCDNDECLGIGYWKAGLPSIVFLEPIGRNPQWLSAGSAALLEKWPGQRGR
jgi:hypothetical protein